MSDQTSAPPEPAEVPQPLADAALRRRVAEIDGWRFFREGGIGFLWGCHCDFEGEPRVVPTYESDLNAADGAVQRWCERNKFEWTLSGYGWSGGRVVECIIADPSDPDPDTANLSCEEVPASHPHAAARAMCEALAKADDALNKNP